MKTKVEIEDGKVVIVLVPENEFEERVIEDYSSSGRDGVVEVVKKKNVWTMEESGVIKILLREIREKLNEVQPPKVNDGFPVGEKFAPPVPLKEVVRLDVDGFGVHKNGYCNKYDLRRVSKGQCEIKERSNLQFCPICGNTDIHIIKEDLKPFGE